MQSKRLRLLLNLAELPIDNLSRENVTRLPLLECRRMQDKPLISAGQYEEFVRAARSPSKRRSKDQLNSLLIERSRDAGKRGTTRAFGPSHNGSSSLWRRGSRTMGPNIALGKLPGLRRSRRLRSLSGSSLPSFGQNIEPNLA